MNSFDVEIVNRLGTDFDKNCFRIKNSNENNIVQLFIDDSYCGIEWSMMSLTKDDTKYEEFTELFYSYLVSEVREYISHRKPTKKKKKRSDRR